MAHRFATVSEEEIVAINEAAYFYPFGKYENNYPPQGR